MNTRSFSRHLELSKAYSTDGLSAGNRRTAYLGISLHTHKIEFWNRGPILAYKMNGATGVCKLRYCDGCIENDFADRFFRLEGIKKLSE